MSKNPMLIEGRGHTVPVMALPDGTIFAVPCRCGGVMPLAGYDPTLRELKFFCAGSTDGKREISPCPLRYNLSVDGLERRGH